MGSEAGGMELTFLNPSNPRSAPLMPGGVFTAGYSIELDVKSEQNSSFMLI